MKSFIKKIIQSWANEEGTVNSFEDLLTWIQELNKATYVNIHECSINDNNFWLYDENNGEILNLTRSFFSIKGLRRLVNGQFKEEQPIILQPEIGYLGIICKEINGVLNFLMQAKIEPGNVNCVQISPTIQATKSNFTRAHGGKLPTYFEIFKHSDQYEVIYDQIQSEQATRFYKKRNRNMIIIVNDEIEIYPNFRWMTLGQIKKLMDIDNLVNMDTRTVLSGIPLTSWSLTNEDKQEISRCFHDQELFRSIFLTDPYETLPLIYHKLNDYKMFENVTTSIIPLKQLSNWKIDEYGITCKEQADFMVRYYDIEIAGREVQHWMQPMFRAIGMATFGLISCIVNGKRRYLVKIKPEIGSFDKAEIGPSVQWEPSHNHLHDNKVDKLFMEKLEKNEDIMVNVTLSEEGGRFYHEQNQNVILEIREEELTDFPNDYIWADFATLNYLVQFNNSLNIQLRNLLSIIKL